MIGILTFYWADDFGAMLQSYALKTYLNRYQHAVLIPYFPKPLRSRYWVVQYNKADHIHRRIYKMSKQLLSKTFFENLKTKKRMNDFRAVHLVEKNRKLKSSKEIDTFTKNIDVFVVGSDQVWNPEITEGFQEGYFCTFRRWRKDDARYISYAASIGTERLKEKHDGIFSELLSGFDMISIREALSKPYIEAMWGREPVVVMDPVFLLEKKEWEQLIQSSDMQWNSRLSAITGRTSTKYIAVYDTEYQSEMAEYIQYLEACTGYDVIVAKPVRRAGRSCRWTEKEKYVSGCGPLEFLELIYHAACVVTNSFHGTAMSIIFRKQFAVFSHSTRGARLLDLLRISHLEKRLVHKRDDVSRMAEKINWEETELALKEEIAHSKQFIKKEILRAP